MNQLKEKIEIIVAEMFNRQPIYEGDFEPTRKEKEEGKTAWEEGLNKLLSLITSEKKQAVEGLRKVMSKSYYEMSEDNNTKYWLKYLETYLNSLEDKK